MCDKFKKCSPKKEVFRVVVGGKIEFLVVFPYLFWAFLKNQYIFVQTLFLMCDT
jgi:hypothetical protein